jgi:hypothetical protein
VQDREHCERGEDRSDRQRDRAGEQAAAAVELEEFGAGEAHAATPSREVISRKRDSSDEPAAISAIEPCRTTRPRSTIAAASRIFST